MLRFTVGGCRLELHFSCFALLAFCCLFAGAAGSAFVFLAVLFHEAAHIGMMLFFHVSPKTVSFSALGCRVVLDPAVPLTYFQNALVSLAGPAANLAAFGVMVLWGFSDHEFPLSCLVLGAFHLLPIEPLDGGLALRALLCCFLGKARAEKISFLISLLFLLPLAILGFLILLHTRYNFSLLAFSLYLMLYLLLKRDYFPS